MLQSVDIGYRYPVKSSHTTFQKIVDIRAQQFSGMQQFRISEEGIKKFRKKWLTLMIPTVIIIPIMAIYFSFSIYRTVRKQKRIMLSYLVTISGEGITRELFNTPTLFISFMEI